MAKTFDDMDLSERAEYLNTTIAAKDATIAAQAVEIKDLKAVRDTLLAKLVENTTITQEDADAIKGAKG